MDFTSLPFFQHVNWRPDARELRRFAIAMLIGFGLLGLLVVWRANAIGTGAVVLWGIGLFLATAALNPKVGKIAYLTVYLPTSFIGYLVSHVILTLIFFLIITPLAIALRLIGKDPLQRRPPEQTGWIAVNNESNEDSYYRQF